MKKAIWMAAAAAMLALPLAAGTAIAASKSKTPGPVNSSDPVIQHINNQIQKNTSRAVAACGDLANFIFEDDSVGAAHRGADIATLDLSLTNLNFLVAEKFDHRNGLPDPDPSSPQFQVDFDIAAAAGYCGIPLGGDGGGG